MAPNAPVRELLRWPCPPYSVASESVTTVTAAAGRRAVRTRGEACSAGGGREGTRPNAAPEEGLDNWPGLRGRHGPLRGTLAAHLPPADPPRKSKAELCRVCASLRCKSFRHSRGQATSTAPRNQRRGRREERVTPDSATRTRRRGTLSRAEVDGATEQVVGHAGLWLLPTRHLRF